jgi:hypothetical protein
MQYTARDVTRPPPRSRVLISQVDRCATNSTADPTPYYTAPDSRRSPRSFERQHQPFTHCAGDGCAEKRKLLPFLPAFLRSAGATHSVRGHTKRRHLTHYSTCDTGQREMRRAASRIKMLAIVPLEPLFALSPRCQLTDALALPTLIHPSMGRDYTTTDPTTKAGAGLGEGGVGAHLAREQTRSL